jgi:vesicle coat complex subunit
MLNEYKQDSLRDLITKSKDLRNVSSFINKSLGDIKKEIHSSDKNVKNHALLKLFFLYLHNHDIKWASFDTLGVLATGGIPGKRLGYLLAQIQFKNNPDCLQMVPNLIRKDLQSGNNATKINALNFYNNVVDLNLANELSKDIEALLNVNNDWIRKKMIVALTKSSEYFLRHDKTNALWDNFMIKMVTMLQDKNVSNGVSICIITAIQRICKNYPERCIATLPTLKEYMINCNINWCTIKILDIFSMLFQYEPKLAKKDVIIKAISQKLALTTSKSVEMQMVKLVITNLDKTENNSITNELFEVCEERLRKLLFLQDNNLVIISLGILKELFNKNKLFTENYLSDILKILDTGNTVEDTGNNSFIQSECIEIINLSANRGNYKTIVDHLVSLKNKIRNKVINTIINICSHDTYSRFDDMDSFIWFLDILFNLASSEFGQETEKRISYTIRDISQRITELRGYIVEKSFTLLQELLGKVNKLNTEDSEKRQVLFVEDSLLASADTATKSADNLISVLVFIISEYAEYARDKLVYLLDIFVNTNYIRESYYSSMLTCLIKLYLKTERDEAILDRLLAICDPRNFDYGEEKLDNLELSILATCVLKSNGEAISLRESFFQTKLLPLHEKAQQMVPPPKDVDLNVCFTLNEEELNISKKIVKDDSSKQNDKVSIDRKLYTPDN